MCGSNHVFSFTGIIVIILQRWAEKFTDENDFESRDMENASTAPGKGQVKASHEQKDKLYQVSVAQVS